MGIIDYTTQYSVGDRRSLIVISCSSGLGCKGYDNPTCLIDGETSKGNVWAFNNINVVGEYFLLDFNKKICINAIKFYSAGNVSQGIWQLQGSNDGINFENVGSNLQLVNKIVTTENVINNINFYRYYKLLGVSGACTRAFANYELEFGCILEKKKYLVKQQNNEYIGIKSDFYKPLGKPKDDAELENWFNKYGTDDLNVLTAIQEKNTSIGVDKGVIGKGKYFIIGFPDDFKGASEVK